MAYPHRAGSQSGLRRLRRRAGGYHRFVALLGYHASHEQFAPSHLVRCVVAAEEAGFGAVMSSDHLAPWSERQGHSGNSWAWLGAAMSATRLPFGIVTAPGQRCHPVVTAQAIATIGELFADRLWVALGSGENLNEHVTGDLWPCKELRDMRLDESADVIARLLTGETVTHRGLVRVDRARVWSRPATPPPLLAAAVGPATAQRVASWADGLVTVAQPVPSLRQTIDAFRDAGGHGKPVYIQVHLSWAPTRAEALHAAFDQWRNCLVPPGPAWDLATPEEFDTAVADANPEDVAEAVKVSTDLGEHAGWIAELLELEPAGVFLHHVGRDQERFVEVFGSEVLPRCR